MYIKDVAYFQQIVIGNCNSSFAQIRQRVSALNESLNESLDRQKITRISDDKNGKTLSNRSRKKVMDRSTKRVTSA